MTNQPLVSVVILNWNGLHHLKKYLPSVAGTDYPALELILADNASEDGSADWVAENYPDIRIIRFKNNHGYCRGNNLAAEQATGELIVFLNNDVRTPSDWLQPVVKLFQKYPKTAAIQPKILSDRNPEYFDYAGAAGGMLDRLGYPWCRGRIMDRIEKDSGQYDALPYPIFWASGAACCLRRNVFLESGGFDEAFQMHMEEIDLCWRLQRSGNQIRYCPDSVVYHLGGGTLAAGNPLKDYYNFRNSLAMLTKNYPEGSLFPVLAMRAVLDGIAGLRFLFTGNARSWLAVCRAYLHFWKALPDWLEIRGELQHQHFINRKVEGFHPQSIVWKYVTGKRKGDKLPFSIELITFFSATQTDRGEKKD